MRMLKQNQKGFIPMIILLIVVIVAAIALVYLRVRAAH